MSPVLTFFRATAELTAVFLFIAGLFAVGMVLGA